MMPISASVSTSASSSTGAVQFGNVKGGSIGMPTWAVVTIALAVLSLIGGGIYFFTRK